MKTENKILLIFFFILMINGEDFDCKKAKLEINYIRNCNNGNHIITIIDNSTIKMDEKCELYTEMCSYIIEYHTAVFDVSISKDNIHHFEDKVDLCHKPKNAQDLSKVAITAFSIPYVCPVASNYTSCGGGKKIFSSNEISKKVVEQLYANNEPTKFFAEINHDTGKSCMEAELKISMI
ncbi:hypothetical protein PVAND_005456 [Polypedilum vanderplanki]|uniref:Uncharacterized protein n=1 Tax=Polypedilum vanderplanki TaxID=319348 RepID=A0A9J6C011_POLVA|nr:hypothetical protein PVAND_005456 [Polypedilum vanderplanki]